MIIGIISKVMTKFKRLKEFQKRFIARSLQIIQNLKELELDDWCRIFFIFGIFLVVFAKPISYFSEIFSIGVYLLGLIFCIGTMYLSDKYIN